MKHTLIFLTVLFGAATAFGQASSLSSQPAVFTIPDHPQRASYAPMATEQPIVGESGGICYAHGERPLWEFGPVSEPPAPLGDVARTYRKEKQLAKKAAVVLEKQGS
jgi:hypothetical protein